MNKIDQAGTSVVRTINIVEWTWSGDGCIH